MKLLAPIVLLLGFSFVLYNTREVWPKDVYDMYIRLLTPPKDFDATVKTLQGNVRSGRMSVEEASFQLSKKLMKGDVVRRGYSAPHDALSRKYISMELD